MLASLALATGAAGPADPLADCLGRKPAETWKLPPLFREVSGLALAADGRLFLHNDEQGVVAAVDYRRGTVLGTYLLGAGTRVFHNVTTLCAGVVA